jgi:hypothetical protein
MPLSYTNCAMCDRPVSRYKGPLQAFCSRKCYADMRRLFALVTRQKEIRDNLKARALELTKAGV